MLQRTSFAIAAGLALLFLALIYVEVWLFPQNLFDTLRAFPEVSDLVAPSIVWVVVTVGCLQVGIALTVRLVLRLPTLGLDRSARRTLVLVIGIMIFFSLLQVAAFAFLNARSYTPPIILLTLTGGVLFGVVAALSVALFLGSRPAAGYRRG